MVSILLLATSLAVECRRADATTNRSRGTSSTLSSSYDFTELRERLAFLERHGKRLWIEEPYYASEILPFLRTVPAP